MNRRFETAALVAASALLFAGYLGAYFALYWSVESGRYGVAAVLAVALTNTNLRATYRRT